MSQGPRVLSSATLASQSPTPLRRQNRFGEKRMRSPDLVRCPTTPAPLPASCHHRPSCSVRSVPDIGYQTQSPPSPPENASSSVAATARWSIKSHSRHGDDAAHPNARRRTEGVLVQPSSGITDPMPPDVLSWRSERERLSETEYQRGFGDGWCHALTPPGLPRLRGPAIARRPAPTRSHPHSQATETESVPIVPARPSHQIPVAAATPDATVAPMST